jgi:hypothetical protein
MPIFGDFFSLCAPPGRTSLVGHGVASRRSPHQLEPAVWVVAMTAFTVAENCSPMRRGCRLPHDQLNAFEHMFAGLCHALFGLPWR